MDKSPLFNPPQDRVPDSDPAIVRVPMEKMDWAARSSQQKSWSNDWQTIKHVKNGG